MVDDRVGWTMTGTAEAGDALPAGTEIIEVYAAELNHLFNAIDPSPFRDKDLDPSAEEFIVSWSRDLPRDAPLGLLVSIDRPAGPTDEPALLRDAIHRFFGQRGEAARRRVSRLFRVGRTSLAIGLVVLGAFLGIGELVARWLSGSQVGALLRESLVIGGWVAMWRPLEIFLYEWWPIRAEARLFDRLAAMPVRIRYAAGGTSRTGR